MELKSFKTRVFDAPLEHCPIEPVNYTHDFMRVFNTKGSSWHAASDEHQRESWR